MCHGRLFRLTLQLKSPKRFPPRHGYQLTVIPKLSENLSKITLVHSLSITFHSREG